MKKLAAFLLLACPSLLIFSCKKKEHCDTATLCVVNMTSKTIHYCWGCNIYSETLAPGEKACRAVRGPIDENSTVWCDFLSDWENRRIEVSDCYEEIPLQ